MSSIQYEVYESINNIKKNEWDNVVENSKISSFFHCYDWQKVLEEGKRLEPRHIVAINNDNIISIFPNYVTSVKDTPFKRLYSICPGYGGPIILSSDERDILDGMYKMVPGICRGNIFSHYVNPYDLSYARYGSFLRKNDYIPHFACRFVIDLNENIEDISNNMIHQKRRNIKKCESIEVIDKEIDKNSLSDFHIHHNNVMKDVGGQGHPEAFFTSMHKHIPENVKIFEAVCNGVPSGQIMFFLDPYKNTVHKFFSGIERKYLKANPTDIIVWQSLNWAKENGFRYYDFGPTEDDFCNGIFRHKSGFGGQTIPIIMWEKVFSRARWKIVEVLRKMYRKL
ncbi:MAG: GNAT family N-acetyltransferase [Candidatus Methanofastidiosa archaeon]|nr:GNAT family N-acetyltransferase [Candidatus Methanofastidiosa archaeon]